MGRLSEVRGKELPLGLTEPGYLFQDVMDYDHKPFTRSSGSGIRSPHLTNAQPRVFTPFAQKMSEVLIEQRGDKLDGDHGLLRAWQGITLSTSMEEVHDQYNKASKYYCIYWFVRD